MSFLSFLLPSLISAGSSLAAGAVSANAAGNAANTQAGAATDAARIQANSIQQALDFEKQQFAVQQNNLAPWLNVGQSGLANLASLMGVLPANTPRSGFNMTNSPTPAPGAGTTSGGAPNPVNYLTNPLNTSYLNPAPGSLTGDPGFGGFGGSGLGADGNGLFSPNPTPTPSGYISNSIVPPNDNLNPNPTNDGGYGPDGFLPPVRQAGGGGKTDNPDDGTGEVGGFTGEGNDNASGAMLREGEGPISRPGEPMAPDSPGPAQREGSLVSPLAQPAQGQDAAPVQPGTPVQPAANPGQLDTLNSLVNPDLGAFGSLAQDWTQKFNAPTDVTEQNDPGYQFRLQQGQKALEASAAARGNLLSGGTGKALQRYGQDYASNEYGNVYNRALGEYQQNYNIFQQNNTNKFNRLAALAGIGQQTASQLNSASQNFASNAGNLLVNSGNAQAQGINNAAAARASGYNNQANAYGNALSTGGSDISQLLMLRQLQQMQGGG